MGYADIPGERTPEINWLRANPHRLHLGRVGFRLTRADGAAASPADLSDVRQTLDLWNGVITSRFRFEGEWVDVQTAAHPSLDAVSVRADSPLIRSGRAAIEIRFPYGTGQVATADWTKPEAHTTVLTQPGPLEARFARTLDADGYVAAARWSAGGALAETGGTRYVCRRWIGHARATVAFSAGPAIPVPGSRRSRRRPIALEPLLVDGRAIDLSGSSDPR